MQKSLGLDRVLHIPNFARRPSPKIVPPGNPHRLLFVGRLSREKGVDVLLRAMPSVLREQPQTRLVVAGEGPERTSLECLATTLGIGDAVQFTGSLSGEKLEEQYHRAGICLLPTLWMENCPVAVLEAMAYGRAVVATRIGGVPELVRDGTTGVLVERANHRDLAGALISLLEPPTKVAEMGRHASEVYAAGYTPEVHLDRLLAVYRGLVSNREPAPCSAAH
jgi:glycosyltransferase involved in cell wall biosynthesis